MRVTTKDFLTRLAPWQQEIALLEPWTLEHPDVAEIARRFEMGESLVLLSAYTKISRGTLSLKLRSAGVETNKKPLRLPREWHLEGDTAILLMPCGSRILVDLADYETVRQHSWRVFSVQRNRYAVGKIDGRRVTMHRLLIGSNAKSIDHINHNGLDNRRTNLRACSQQQNLFNKRPKLGKAYKGTQYSAGTYYATLTKNGTQYKSIGHLTEESAARAYDELAMKHFGEFAWLNFPTQTSEAV